MHKKSAVINVVPYESYGSELEFFPSSHNADARGFHPNVSVALHAVMSSMIH